MTFGRHVFRLVTLSLMLQAAAAFGQGVTLPDFERIELDNGTVLLLSEKPEVPLVSVTAILRGGAVVDPDGRGGLANLLAALLAKGAGDRDAAQFAETIDASGGTLASRAELETITVAGNFLARDADLMVELLADMLLRPRLDEAEFEKLRARSVNFIRAAKDTNLNALLPIYGQGLLFGAHPYGNPVSGSETTLAAIGHEDVLDFYEQQLGGDRLIVAVTGDFDAPSMIATLTAAFGDWRPAAAPMRKVVPAAPQEGRRVLLVDKPGATQTYFWLGNVGVALDYDNRAALDIANTVFGGRFTSMLNTELRIESGLTYGAQSQLSRASQPGSIAVTSFTPTETTFEAIDMALAVLGRLHEGGVDTDMLVSARNYILGQFPTALETAAQLGRQLATLEAFDLGVAYVNDYGQALVSADTETVAAVIDAVYPRPDNLVFVLLGDAEAIRERAGEYGPVTEIQVTEPHFRPPAIDGE
ncbi:MAG TPA: pitrilysin family protein [Woeseiaceae bacterium]|nr:pitrilysin family protein [Woeseiaceae bacterium]